MIKCICTYFSCINMMIISDVLVWLKYLTSDSIKDCWYQRPVWNCLPLQVVKVKEWELGSLACAQWPERPSLWGVILLLYTVSVLLISLQLNAGTLDPKPCTCMLYSGWVLLISQWLNAGTLDPKTCTCISIFHIVKKGP